MGKAVLLQYSSAEDLGSWAIRSYDHGPWSHVDALLDDGRLLGARSDICQGVPAGVQIRPPGYCAFSTLKRVEIPATDEVVDAYYAFLQAQLGKPYDALAIAAFIPGRDWREEDAWFCSELQGAAGEASKLYRYRLATPNNRLTPNAHYLVSSVLADIWSGVPMLTAPA
jgi:hypothetical protein